MPLSLHRRYALKLLASAPFSQIATAAPRLSFRRGVNFHHMLNWPQMRHAGAALDYDWPPFQAAHYQTSDAELRELRRWGFDFIRLTADPSIFMLASGARWAQLRDHVEATLRRLLAAGFSVIFDLHPVAVNPGYAPAILARGGAEFAAYVEMTGRMAATLRDYSRQALVFELLNEPPLAAGATWQTMLETLHASARANAPDLPLMLTGAQWGDRQALMRLDLAPFKASNVYYTFHYYDPHAFTHQGVVGDEAQYLTGVRWPFTAAADLRASARARITALPAAAQADALARTERVIDKLAAGQHDSARVARDFAEVGQWADRNAIARDRIVLGEFGCVLAANGQMVGADRLAWLQTVRQAAEAEAFAWAYWAYKGYGGMELADQNGKTHADLRRPLGLAGG